ncbi:MAG TPA: hypothetical protein VGG62_00735 [Terracidiphilus sp.]|jgi:hypothetical protein
MSYVSGSGSYGGYGGALASLFGGGGGNTTLNDLVDRNPYPSTDPNTLQPAVDYNPYPSTDPNTLQQVASNAPAQVDPNQASAPTGPMLATALTNAQLGIPPVTTDPNDPTGGNQSPTEGGPDQPAADQRAQPWGTPLPGSGGRTPPPGYRPISDAPNAPGGQPPPQGGGQQAAPQGGGGGMPRLPPAQQGAGAVGNMGGAAGTPLPQLIARMMQRMRQQGQIPPWARGPGGLTRPGYGVGAGRYPMPGRGRAPFSPQSPRAFVPREAMGGSYAPRGLGGSRGPVPQGPNYMQRLYQGEYPPHESTMRNIQTPAGPMKVNPLAAGDVQGFTRDLQRHGFPFEKPWGSYNRRRMRWSNNWSSHSWGTAFDMDNQDGPMSPRAQRWMQQNPGLFQQLMRQWNMSQPLPGRDPRHIEWNGPNPQYHPPQQTADGGGGPYGPDIVQTFRKYGTQVDAQGNPILQGGGKRLQPDQTPVTTDSNDPTGGNQSSTGSGPPAESKPPDTAPANADPAGPDLSSMFAADDTEEDDTSVA